MRVRLVAFVALAWLAAATPALAAERTVDRGIVQSVTPTAIVLRGLDGVEVDVPLGPGTHFRLNGLPATLADIRPGFVAEAVRDGSQPTALRVRAFGRIAAAERGRLVGVRAAWLVMRTEAGRRTRIALTADTVVRRAGRVVPRRTLRVGQRVAVVRAEDGSAQVVRILQATA